MKPDLHLMSFNDDAPGIRRALEGGADPNEPHPNAGSLPVRLACQANSLNALRELLNGGANADAVFTFKSRVTKRVVSGRTPLMYVESCEAARLLLDAGADINRVDSMGWSAVVHAAHGENEKLVELLLTRGADTLVRPWYDGRQLSLLEFVQNRCAYLDENAQTLRQPEAAESLADLTKVKAAIERFLGI